MEDAPLGLSPVSPAAAAKLGPPSPSRYRTTCNAAWHKENNEPIEELFKNPYYDREGLLFYGIRKTEISS